MNTVTRRIEEILRRHPAPAVRVQEVLDRLRALGGGGPSEASTLLAHLSAHPGRFRVIDPWKGAWRPVKGARTTSSYVARAWVVLVDDDGPDPDPDAPPLARLLRQTVRWLSDEADTRSTINLARWHSALTEADEAGEHLRKAA